MKEIIVVDDHSTDNSWTLLQNLQARYPQLYISRNPNKGANRARNYGFSLATGDYIQWLDADDQLLPGKFEAQLRTFAENPDTDLVFSDWYMDHYHAEEPVSRTAVKKHAFPDFLEALLRDNWSVPCNYLLRRSLAQELHIQEAWYPSRTINQDREYFTFAGILRAKARYVPGFFCIYNRWGAATKKQVTPTFTKQKDLQAVLLRVQKAINEEAAFSGEQLAIYNQIINAQLLTLFAQNKQLAPPLKIGFWEIDWAKAGRLPMRFGLKIRAQLFLAYLRQRR